MKKEKSAFDLILERIINAPDIKRLDAVYFYCEKEYKLVLYRMSDKLLRIDIKLID